MAQLDYSEYGQTIIQTLAFESFEIFVEKKRKREIEVSVLTMNLITKKYWSHSAIRTQTSD